MKVLLSWLREFAPIQGDPDDLAVQLTDLGMELESVERVGDGLEGIVVAEVLDIREHPDADKIRLVDVDAGDGEALQICCGASNMSVGDLVPLATIGTVMPGGMEIARRKMRGQTSNGMLCSAREMEVGDDHDGILLLPRDLRVGTSIIEALDLRSDVVYDFDALPNRPDTLSVMGVARDLAARQGVPFAIPPYDPTTSGGDASALASVRIDAPELCGSFLVRVLSGVQLGPSPRWMAQRLLAAGMRPINNVVDVSNYVMLELGHPNHAYDLAKLPGGALAVRWARDGETLRTLDDVTRTLTPRDGVIVDGEDTVVGLAGVMGGASTEISSMTTDVLLELAWWDPQTIADTSARHQLHSEASLRYKRGVDTALAPLAARRFAQLLGEISGARLHPGEVAAQGDLPSPPRITVRTSRVNGLLGTELDRDRIASLIAPIGFTSEVDGEDLVVEVPTWRPDTTIEEDVIEEVARHFGMSNIPKSVPVSPHTGELTARQRERRVLRDTLVGAGLSEAMPMPFLAPGDLERCGLPGGGLVLANPLAAEESVLRTSLLPGLLAAVAHNASHRQPGVGLYELGRVFGLGGGVLTDVAESERAARVLDGEVEHLAVVMAGVEAPAAVRLLETLLRSTHRWEAPVADGAPALAAEIGQVELVPAEVPGLHPGRGAIVLVGGVAVGQVGEVDPGVLRSHDIEERVAWLQLDLTTLLSQPAAVPQASAISRFPSSDVDLAFVVEEDLAASEVRATIAGAAIAGSDGGTVPVSVELFDVFRSPQLGEQRKSLAYRLRFQAADRTLTDADVATVRQAVIDAVTEQHGATLRA
ncbi:MAG: phenylalanine--tRNA ligase subunit beta [Microthrixaceae bacterium]